MSTTQDNNTRSPMQSKRPSTPDGQSELPKALPDFPPPTSGDPGSTGSPEK